ncbi:hypothetical protein V6Z12_A09G109500 [Gossypium hirsutum]
MPPYAPTFQQPRHAPVHTPTHTRTCKKTNRAVANTKAKKKLYFSLFFDYSAIKLLIFDCKSLFGHKQYKRTHIKHTEIQNTKKSSRNFREVISSSIFLFFF